MFTFHKLWYTWYKFSEHCGASFVEHLNTGNKQYVNYKSKIIHIEE
jgi:hypothetical protein